MPKLHLIQKIKNSTTNFQLKSSAFKARFKRTKNKRINSKIKFKFPKITFRPKKKISEP